MCAENFQLSYCCKIFRAHFGSKKLYFFLKIFSKTFFFLAENVRGKFYNNMIIGIFPRTIWAPRKKKFWAQNVRGKFCNWQFIGNFSAHILGLKNLIFFSNFLKKNIFFGPKMCAENFPITVVMNIFRAHLGPMEFFLSF